MRKLLIVLGILIFLDIFYFSFVNHGQMLSFAFPPFGKQFSMDSGAVYLTMALYGALGAFLLTYYRLLAVQDRLKKQSRNTEKASIEAEESTDKVKSLQAKIDTLEVALKEALSKK